MCVYVYACVVVMAGRRCRCCVCVVGGSLCDSVGVSVRVSVSVLADGMNGVRDDKQPAKRAGRQAVCVCKCTTNAY